MPQQSQITSWSTLVGVRTISAKTVSEDATPGTDGMVVTIGHPVLMTVTILKPESMTVVVSKTDIMTVRYKEV